MILLVTQYNIRSIFEIRKMGIRNTIPLKEDICAGIGKFSVCQVWVKISFTIIFQCNIHRQILDIFLHNTNRKESSDSHVAIVHSDTVELVILDKRGIVVQQHLLEFDELFVDNKPDDIQVRIFSNISANCHNFEEERGTIEYFSLAGIVVRRWAKTHNRSHKSFTASYFRLLD